MILVIDNYDSFVYNLVQQIGSLGEKPAVRRNDAVTLKEIERMQPDGIIISPGPGTPGEAGICLKLVSRFSGRFPILGVCLGHQCIGQTFGARVVKGKLPVHGKTSALYHKAKGILAGIPQGIKVTRYHSLVVDKVRETGSLQVVGYSSDGCNMAICHTQHPTYGLQFHPESIATQYGMNIMENFLNIIQERGLTA